MTKDHRRLDAQTVQGILLDDPDFLHEIVERVLQELLEAEMTQHLGAAPHERTNARKGHRNGYKPRTLRTRVGTLNLLVPQDREGTFSTRLFCRYDGFREILGVEVADTESEATYHELFRSLKTRGLREVELVVSDDHQGLKAAVDRHFQGASWQRCLLSTTRGTSWGW